MTTFVDQLPNITSSQRLTFKNNSILPPCNHFCRIMESLRKYLQKFRHFIIIIDKFRDTISDVMDAFLPTD